MQSQAALKKLRDERLSDAEAAGDQAAQLAELRAAADTAEDRSNELLAALSQAEAAAAEAAQVASSAKAELAACRTQLQDEGRAAAAELESLRRQMEDAATEAAGKAAELEAEAESRLDEAEKQYEKMLQNAEKLRRHWRRGLQPLLRILQNVLRRLSVARRNPFLRCVLLDTLIALT